MPKFKQNFGPVRASIMTGILVDIGFLDFLSRIPTIPELKRYKSEIVIKEVEEDEGGSSSDSSSDGEAD